MTTQDKRWQHKTEQVTIRWDRTQDDKTRHDNIRALHVVVSCLVVSCPILSYRGLFCLVSSSLVLSIVAWQQCLEMWRCRYEQPGSYLLLSCPLLFCRVLFCRVMPCLALPCLVLPVLLWLVFFCLVMPCLFLSCLVVVLSCPVLLCLVFSCLVKPCLFLSYLIFSYLVPLARRRPLNSWLLSLATQVYCRPYTTKT